MWRVYAYRGYLLLQRLDRSLLEPRLPAAIFYNLLVSARAPALGAGTAAMSRAASSPSQPQQAERSAAASRAAAALDSLTTQPSTASTNGTGRLGTPRSRRSSDRGRRGQPPLRGDLIEHEGRLGRGRQAAQPTQHPPRHLPQAIGAGGAAQPGGCQDEQPCPGGAPGRDVEAEPAAEGEDEGAAGQEGGEQETGGQRLLVRPRREPGQRQPERHRRQQRPFRAGEQEPEGNGSGQGDGARVEAALAEQPPLHESDFAPCYVVKVRVLGGELVPVGQAAPVDDTWTVLAKAAQTSRPRP